MSEPFVSGVRALYAEGARVGFVSCLLCGAAILLDPASGVDMVGLHADWHESLPVVSRVVAWPRIPRGEASP